MPVLGFGVYQRLSRPARALIASAAPPIPDVVAAAREAAASGRGGTDADLQASRNGSWKKWVGFHRFPNFEKQ